MIAIDGQLKINKARLINLQGLSVNMHGGLKREIRSSEFSSFSVPVEFRKETYAIVAISREEWIYKNGNDVEDVRFEDCLPWQVW